VTAAQTVGLEEMPILVGDFDDKEALIRSISENLASVQKDVETQTRASAIWRLWKLHVNDMGEDLSTRRNMYPTAQKISSLLGVPTSTARLWIQPLKDELAGTELDPRVNLNNDDQQTHELSESLADISPQKISLITETIGLSGDRAVDFAKKVQEDDLTIEQVSEVADISGDFENAEKAVDAVLTAEKAAEDAKGFVLKQQQYGQRTSEGLREAARDMGSTRDQVVKTAVKYFLREEDYL
jgi:hypothetical protein